LLSYKPVLCLQIVKPSGLETLQVVLKTQITHKNALTCAIQQAHACQPVKEAEFSKRYDMNKTQYRIKM